MGLITALLGWPFAPVYGVAWVAEQILAEAERQWSDPSRIQASLEEVDELLAAGLITDEQAAELEDQLVRRLMGEGWDPRG